MKLSSLAPTLLAATLFLSPALHAADTPADPMTSATEDTAARAKRDAEILKRFDKNNDGLLDENEKAAAKEHNRAHGEERREKARAKLGKKAVQRFDKNGDGQLDAAEKAEAIETDPKVVKRFDQDHDGKLNAAEKAAAHEAVAKHRQKRAAARNSGAGAVEAGGPQGAGASAGEKAAPSTPPSVPATTPAP